MNIGGEDFAKVDFQPSDQGSILFLFLGYELVSLALSCLQRFLVVDEIAHDESEKGTFFSSLNI